MLTTQVKGGRQIKPDGRKDHHRKQIPRSPIAQRIDGKAKLLGMSRVDVAKAIEISYPTFNRILRKGEVAARLIVPLAEALGTSPTYLLTGEGEEDPLDSLSDAVNALDETARRLGKGRIQFVDDKVALQARIDHMVEVLEYVEWRGHPDDHICPFCDGELSDEQAHTHADDCAIGAVLADVRERKVAQAAGATA